AKRFVFHCRNLALVPERHRRETACRVKRLELSSGGTEMQRLSLRQRLPLLTPAVSHYPRKRCVVSENALERVDDLIIERRLRILRKSADKDLHLVNRIELIDSVLRENVHHSRRETAVRNDRDSLFTRSRIELFLLEDNVGISAEIAK